MLVTRIQLPAAGRYAILVTGNLAAPLAEKYVIV